MPVTHRKWELNVINNSCCSCNTCTCMYVPLQECVLVNQIFLCVFVNPVTDKHLILIDTNHLS